MSQPVEFSSTTARFSLPLLFQGQSQKEFFYNEAMSLIDTLLAMSVEGEATSPPAEPEESECWIIGSPATGIWEGKEGEIAALVAGAWKFHQPSPGLRVFDKAAGQTRHFNAEWSSVVAPPEPTGGSTVDQEARAAIGEIVNLLRSVGILPVA